MLWRKGKCEHWNTEHINDDSVIIAMNEESYDKLIQEIEYNGNSRGRKRVDTGETIKKKITKFPEAQKRLESSDQLCDWEKLIKVTHM